MIKTGAKLIRGRNLRQSVSGFSLLEMAVIMVIIGLLLGGLIEPLSAQREKAKIRETQAQLEEIKTALLGFAAINGRLPCPTIPGNNGREAVVTPGIPNCDNGIAVQGHGFVPANTLGLAGQINPQGLLLDAWGSPIRYSVSTTDFNANLTMDFVVAGEMRQVGMASLNPDLVICQAASATGIACDAGEELIDNVPVVIFSTGKDWAQTVNADTRENAGENPGGAAIQLGGFDIAQDRVFVSRTSSSENSPNGQFDDLVTWIPASILYSHMMQARQLP